MFITGAGAFPGRPRPCICLGDDDVTVDGLVHGLEADLLEILKYAVPQRKDGIEPHYLVVPIGERLDIGVQEGCQGAAVLRVECFDELTDEGVVVVCHTVSVPQRFWTRKSIMTTALGRCHAVHRATLME